MQQQIPMQQAPISAPPSSNIFVGGSIFGQPSNAQVAQMNNATNPLGVFSSGPQQHVYPQQPIFSNAQVQQHQDIFGGYPQHPPMCFPPPQVQVLGGLFSGQGYQELYAKQVFNDDS